MVVKGVGRWNGCRYVAGGVGGYVAGGGGRYVGGGGGR